MGGVVCLLFIENPEALSALVVAAGGGPAVGDDLFEGFEVHLFHVRVEAVLLELVVHVALRHFPEPEIIQDIAGVTHLDEARRLRVVELEGFAQVGELTGVRAAGLRFRQGARSSARGGCWCAAGRNLFSF